MIFRWWWPLPYFLLIANYQNFYGKFLRWHYQTTFKIFRYLYLLPRFRDWKLPYICIKSQITIYNPPPFFLHHELQNSKTFVTVNGSNIYILHLSKCSIFMFAKIFIYYQVTSEKLCLGTKSANCAEGWHSNWNDTIIQEIKFSLSLSLSVLALNPDQYSLVFLDMTKNSFPHHLSVTIFQNI